MIQGDSTPQSISVEVIFSVGSNCGDRHDNVRKGLEWLSELLVDFTSSRIYATPDCHGSDREYINAVARGKTSSTPETLEFLCKEYEKACGRDEAMRKSGKVPVDIDLVVYDNKVLRPNDFKREFFKIGYGMI